MNSHRLYQVLCLGNLILLGLGRNLTAADAPGMFRDKIAPIFERHCVRCHNDEEHKGGLSLTSSTAAKKGGDAGAAWVDKNPQESLLLQYVEGDKPEMPKNSPPLSPQQIADLRKWMCPHRRPRPQYGLSPLVTYGRLISVYVCVSCLACFGR